MASGSTSTGTASYRSSPYYDFAFSPSYVDISLSAISLPANVGTINVIGKVYAQAFHNKSTTYRAILIGITSFHTRWILLFMQILAARIMLWEVGLSQCREH